MAHCCYLLWLVYLEPLANVHPSRSAMKCCSLERLNHSVSCCCSYVGIYTVIILRIQQDALLDMGFDSILYPIGFSCQRHCMEQAVYILAS